jgi:similar to stage IV sporulation protein
VLLTRILRDIGGNVRFKAEGGCIGRFLTDCAKAGAALWDIVPTECGVCASAFTRDYPRMRAAAKKHGIKLEVVGCRGLPFRMKKLAKRRGLITGAALFIVLMCFFSSFIWRVDVSGNSSVSSAEITSALSGLGLRPGVSPAGLDLKKLENEALVRLPRLAWISINVDGSDAHIKVRERRYPPDVIPQSMPCNIKALESGQIISLEVRSGKAAVRVGDTVEKGGLIISGVVADKNGATLLMHAGGKAVARVRRTLSVSVPYVQTVSVDAGKGVRRDTLGVFGLRIPLYLDFKDGAAENERITVRTRSLTLMGVKLPVELTKRDYIPVKSAQTVFTKEQAGALAQKQLRVKEDTELYGDKLVSRSVAGDAGKDAFILTGSYLCEENIACEEEIPLT